MLKQLKFFKVALFDRQIGAIARSSKYVVKAVVRDFENQPMHRVVEYGPGDGVMTRELLKRMPKNGQLIAVESNPKFLKILKKIGDPRLRVIKGTVQNVSRELQRHHKETIDLVVSSIPFSMLKPIDREKVVHNTFEMLNDGGRFIVFHQYSRLMLSLLKKHFNADSVDTQFELRNVLPCFIMHAQK
jgi:phospholipid N-methyltransferase